MHGLLQSSVVSLDIQLTCILTRSWGVKGLVLHGDGDALQDLRSIRTHYVHPQHLQPPQVQIELI